MNFNKVFSCQYRVNYVSVYFVVCCSGSLPPTKYEIDLTHLGMFVYVLLQTHVRFVPDNNGSLRLDPWTVGQSLSELVTLPLLCESSDKSRDVFEAPSLSATSPQYSLSTKIHWLLLPPCRSPQLYRTTSTPMRATFKHAKLCKLKYTF